MSGGSIWASLECQCCFWIAGGLVPCEYYCMWLLVSTMWLLTLQLFKNSFDTQGKLSLNLHSLSVSVSELLEYRRKSSNDYVKENIRLESSYINKMLIYEGKTTDLIASEFYSYLLSLEYIALCILYIQLGLSHWSRRDAVYQSVVL